MTPTFDIIATHSFTIAPPAYYTVAREIEAFDLPTALLVWLRREYGIHFDATEVLESQETVSHALDCGCEASFTFEAFDAASGLKRLVRGPRPGLGVDIDRPRRCERHDRRDADEGEWRFFAADHDPNRKHQYGSGGSALPYGSGGREALLQDGPPLQRPDNLSG